jgi:hypothetical protein
MTKADQRRTVGSQGTQVKTKQPRGRPRGSSRGQRRNTLTARTSKLRGNTAVTGDVRMVGINDRDPPRYLLQNYRLAHPDDAEWSVLKPAVVEFLALWRRNNPGDAMLGLRAIRTIKKGEFITGGEMGGVIRRFDKSEKPTHARLLPGKRLFVVDASKPRDRGRRLGALINTGPAATYNCRYTYKKVRPEVLLCQALIDIDAGVELVMGYGGSFTVPKAPQ